MMKKLFSFVLLFFVVSICAAQEPKRVAVYVEGPIATEYMELLGDNIAEGLNNSNEFQAVNRSEDVENAIRAARERQQDGRVDITQIINGRKEFAENYLFIVKISEIGNLYSFRAKLTEMEKNILVNSITAPLPKDSLNYASIIQMSQKLLSRFVKTSTYNDEIESFQKQEQNAIERSMALKRYEDAQVEYNSMKKERNISYAAFRAEHKKYIGQDPGSRYYFTKGENTIDAGHILWIVPGLSAVAISLGVGLADIGNLNNMKAPIIIGSIVGSMLPTFSCYIAGAAYKKKAWKIYTQPYRDAEKELDAARDSYKATGIQIAPAAGYDWAGLSVKVSF